MPWALWSYDKPTLPTSVHASATGLRQAFEWLKAKRYASRDHHLNRAGELEQAVLGIGLILRDLMKMQFAHSPSSKDTHGRVLAQIQLSLDFGRDIALLEDALTHITTINPEKCTPRFSLRRRKLPLPSYLILDPDLDGPSAAQPSGQENGIAAQKGPNEGDSAVPSAHLPSAGSNNVALDEEDEEEDLLNEVDENSTPRPLQIRPLLIFMLLIHRNYRT